MNEQTKTLSAILKKNETLVLLHCDTGYEQNEGCAEIQKIPLPYFYLGISGTLWVWQFCYCFRKRQNSQWRKLV